MNIVLYGMGQAFHKLIKHMTDEFEVLAICDRRFLNECSIDAYNQVPFITPMQLQMIDYDYIVICSNKFYESIRTDLIGNFYVDEDRIISARLFYKELFLCDRTILCFYEKRVNEHKNILTFNDGMHLYPYIKTSGENDHCLNLALIWGLNYDHMYSLDYENTEIIWCLSYRDITKLNIKEIIEHFSKYYCMRKLRFYSGVVFEFAKKKQVNHLDAKIYVVCHKNYNVIRNDLYEPLMVGVQNLNDCSMEQIDCLNDVLNECTALYWVWKNSKAKVVGLNHYRRIFCNDDIISYNNILEVERLRELLLGFDIILPSLTFLDCSIYDNISCAVGEGLASLGRKIVFDLMKSYQPDYCDDFMKVMDGNVMYACNMFVTYHEIMDEYCKWLFSFIIDAAKKLDVSRCTVRQKRTIGYFAEAMMTVWLLRKNFKVYTLPIIVL